jgi:hypothetical protein
MKPDKNRKVLPIIKGGENVKKQATILMLTLITAFIICGAVSAADTSDNSSTNIQSDSNQSSNTTLPDPSVIRGGVVVYSSSTITDAINHAIDGDTIAVEAGNYPEDVLVNKRLNITATGAATVKSFMIIPLGDGSIIQGFTINNSDPFGVNLNLCSNCQILRNVITGNLGAITIFGNNNLISENTLIGTPNPAGWSEIVFFSNNAMGNTLSKNNITALSTLAGGAYAVWLNGGSTNTVSENKIISTATGTGNAFGIFIDTNSNTITQNNITTTANSNDAYGVYMLATANSNNINGNSITAQEGVYTYNANNLVNFNRIISSDKAISLPTEGTLDALYNWYGSNSDPSAKINAPNQGSTINYNPWLIMTVTASPTTIYTGGTSTVKVDFTHDSAGGVHDPTLGHFPDDVGVLVTSTGGEVGSYSTTAYTLNGVATAIFRATQGPGTGTAAGSLDSQTPLSTTINVLQGPTANAATSTSVTDTIGMETTGAPIIPLAVAIMSVLGGLAASRKNK